MGSNHEILLVEEDERTRSFLATELASDGYEVKVAEDRARALALLTARQPALVLADVNGQTIGLLDAVHGGEGLAGRVDPDTPVIVLTSRSDELTRVRVFDHAGDDVVGKPFSYLELRGRIAAVLRRSYAHQHRQVRRVGRLTVDLGTREVHVDEHPVALTSTEFALLRALGSGPTRVFTREELLRDVWGYRSPVSRTRTVDTHAYRLRQKLAAAGADRGYVINVWEIGYRLYDLPTQAAA